MYVTQHPSLGQGVAQEAGRLQYIHYTRQDSDTRGGGKKDVYQSGHRRLLCLTNTFYF